MLEDSTYLRAAIKIFKLDAAKNCYYYYYYYYYY